MEYAAFAFGIFGLFAYLQAAALKRRIDKIEQQLARTAGTDYYDERRALLKAAKAYIGEPVGIRLKEDHEDVDISMYGNTKHGSNTILDVDEDWLLVHVKTPKGEKDKLIRIESIQGLRLNG